MSEEKKYYTVEKAQQIILALLKAHKIRKVVASPGTTNLTLVASMQQDPWFEMYSSVDERSAAYLACGIAAESGEPVVISCTEATASRNYMSGLTEAYYRKLPILAITCNHGSTRVGHGIAQVIDRSAIPNDIAKVSVDIPVVKDNDGIWNCTVKVNKAILALTHNGGGPAHINLATHMSRDYSVQKLPPVRVIRRVTTEDKFPALPQGRIGVIVGSHKRWAQAETQALDNFCATNNAVVLCDQTSGYRGKYRVLFSLVASQTKYASPLNALDLVIHIGEVSGDYYSLSVGTRSKQIWRVNKDGELRDTMRHLTYIFQMNEETFFNHYSREGVSHTELLEEYKSECALASSFAPEIPFSNAWIAQQIAPKMPGGSQVHLGILNTLRSWNFVEVPQDVETYCNVGGFGIDGDISAMIGSSTVHRDKLYYAVLGDLAFFYDMNVMGNRHVGNNCRILLINNGRGTEFRNYGHPGHDFGTDADAYIAAGGHFGKQSPCLVKHYAEDLGYEYMTAANKEQFLAAYERFLAPEVTDKPMVFEVFTTSEDEDKALELLRTCIPKEPGEKSKGAASFIKNLFKK